VRELYSREKLKAEKKSAANHANEYESEEGLEAWFAAFLFSKELLR
jgi:hypothetical protein